MTDRLFALFVAALAGSATTIGIHRQDTITIIAGAFYAAYAITLTTLETKENPK